MTRRPPIHVSKCYIPDQGEIVYEKYPTNKLKGFRGYCKYCDVPATHSDWWQMKFEDYGHDVVLCGKCEYTHLKTDVQ